MRYTVRNSQLKKIQTNRGFVTPDVLIYTKEFPEKLRETLGEATQEFNHKDKKEKPAWIREIFELERGIVSIVLAPRKYKDDRIELRKDINAEYLWGEILPMVFMIIKIHFHPHEEDVIVFERARRHDQAEQKQEYRLKPLMQ